MNKRNKTITIASLIATLGVGATGASTAYAAQHATDRQSSMSGLVEALATKFHLAPSDVQSVIDQQRKLMFGQPGRGERGIRPPAKGLNPKAMLDKAVADGTITQAQEDLIIAKQADVRTFMDSLKGKSAADRQSAMKTETEALKTWAQSNNIPERFIMPFGGRMRPEAFDRT